MMRPAHEDLIALEPVWEALSDMFLDTDTSLSLDWRARQLAESPYSLEELESILAYEVFPVCIHNLMVVTGEWEFFDPLWLWEKILRRVGARRWMPRALQLGHWFAPRFEEWQITRRAVADIRNAPNSRCD